MKVIVEFSVIPLEVGVSISKLVASAVKELEGLGVKHTVTHGDHIRGEER